jgi:hypothetical protein
MRGHARRIGYVGSLEGDRAYKPARATEHLSGGDGFYLGGHSHQRKLFSLPVLPGGSILLALGAGLFGAIAPILLALPRRVFAPRAAGTSGIAGRRVELPASSFWKGLCLQPVPEKFFVMRGALVSLRPSIDGRFAPRHQQLAV